MTKCIACGKNVLLPTEFGRHTLCRSCAIAVNLSSWKNRDCPSINDLLLNKENALKLAHDNNFSDEAIQAIKKYFDEYIDAGYQTTLNGIAGQSLKLFDNYVIVSTKDENKRQELSGNFILFPDNDDTPETSFLSSQMDNIVDGLFSGKLIQTGIGLATSAILDYSESEKRAERKLNEHRQKLEQSIIVGDYKILLNTLLRVELFYSSGYDVGYLRFIPKDAPISDYYASKYFFFKNSIPFESKKIRQCLEEIKNQLNDKISSLEQESTVFSTESTTTGNTLGAFAPNSSDPFSDIRKFKQLLDDGIISEEEFQKKKKELLGL